MDNLINEFAKLEELARDWSKLTEGDDLGWIRYAEEYVSTYRAFESDHRAVQIGEFQIGFHVTPKVEFPLRDLGALESTVRKGRELLEAETQRRVNMTDEEKRLGKEQKKKFLLEALAKLDAA